MFKAAGRDFCIRYIPRTSKPSSINLTHDEALIILNAGLALMPVQHAPPEGWTPTPGLGTEYGAYGAYYAKEIVGLPEGMNIWCDLEMVGGSSSADAVIAYCEEWYAAVEAAGYVPGVYVGFGIKINNKQLTNLSFRHYWRAYNADNIPARGYQLIQSEEIVIGGITVDPNKSQADKKGDAALWLSL